MGALWSRQRSKKAAASYDDGEETVAGSEARVLTLVGVAEIVFGVLLLALWRARSLFVANAYHGLWGHVRELGGIV